MAKLIDLCSKGSSNIAQKDLAACEGQYPIYGAAGFIKNVDFYHQDKPYIAIVKDGAGVGRVMKLPAHSSVIGTMQYIIPNEGVNVSYLAYALEHMNLAKYYLGAAIPHIYFKDYCNEELPTHTAEEQNNIALSLDKVTELIALRKEQLAKLDQLVKSRFIELFIGKYRTVKLGDVAKTMSGGTPSRTHPEYYENGTIPWLTSGEVNAGVIFKVKNYITEQGMKNSSAKIVPANSVVVAMYGATAGVTGLIRLDTTTNQAVCSILPNERFIPEYLYYAVALQKEWMISQCQGGGQPNISQGVIKNMDIIDAPIELQEQFAAFVKQTDKSKLAIQQSLEKLEMLKKSLMQEYFG